MGTSTRRILSHSNIAIMGNDGGSIPKRRELVKDAARAATLSELKATALESLAHAWSHCALSGDPIDLDSVVSDWRGRLYSYEAVLTGLTSDSDDGDSTQTTPSSLGIKSLRDVAKLKFNRTGDKWTCPISMKELGPSTKTVYIVPCGHVFAEVAMKEIKEKACPECSEEFKEENTITILPTTDEETERLQKRMEDLRAAGLTHTLKKDKSEKKKKRKAGESNGIADHEGRWSQGVKWHQQLFGGIRDCQSHGGAGGEEQAPQARGRFCPQERLRRKIYSPEPTNGKDLKLCARETQTRLSRHCDASSLQAREACCAVTLAC